MIEDLKKDTEDAPETAPATDGAPKKKKKKKKQPGVPVVAPAADGAVAGKKKKKKKKSADAGSSKPDASKPDASKPDASKPDASKPKKKKKKLKSGKPDKTAKPDKAKSKTGKKPKKKAAVKATPVHKEDIFRPDSRLGVAFALLKDGKPHTKKEIAAAIKKKCGSVPWPHRIFGHLRARAAETGKFLLREPERGVFVLTMRK